MNTHQAAALYGVCERSYHSIEKGQISPKFDVPSMRPEDLTSGEQCLLYRRRRKMTTEEASSILGIHRNYVSRAERNNGLGDKLLERWERIHDGEE